MTDSLFRNLLFLLFVSAAFAARASPIIESSHLSRLLEIHNRERAPPSVQVAAARGVLARLLPSHLSSFDFEIISKEQCGGVFCFNISNHPSRGDKGAPEVSSSGIFWKCSFCIEIQISFGKNNTARELEWLNSYSRRRYGKFVPALQDAWGILYHTIYNCTDGANDKNRDVIVAFPDIEPSLIWKETSTSPKVQLVNRQNTLPHETSDSFDQPHLWYSTTDVIRALELFLAYGDEVSDSNTFRYDLIDLTRQALAKYGNQVFLMVIEAYQLNDVKKVTSYSQQFLDIVEDMDTLLACHNGYLLGPWLQSAKQLAKDLEEEKQYEWNARTQITMWFDNTDTEASLLRDYGNKYWSGLLADYYKPRAAIYFKCMIKSLVEGKSFPLEEWRREWISLTNKWQNSRKLFAVRPSGDALSISRKLFAKYLANSTATSFRTSSY